MDLTRKLLFILGLAAVVLASRKYDIEDECRKQYHQDCATVVRKFRRTPEYLRILQDKLDEMNSFYYDVKAQVKYFYSDKIEYRVADALCIDYRKVKDSQNILSKISTTTMAPTGTTCSNDTHQALKIRKNPKGHRREGEEEGDESTVPNGIKKLEKYEKFFGHLSVSERNMMRDIGFEYTGNIIHGIRKAFGTDETQSKSTVQPGDNEEEPSTKTEHVEIHEVTTGTTAVTSPGGTESGAPTQQQEANVPPSTHAPEEPPPKERRFKKKEFRRFY